jgi:DNA-binding LacI/PurR family transcriptional regulator
MGDQTSSPSGRSPEPPRPAPAPQGPATIFGVADQAGVSITTVSHVFSGKRHVSEETRERVLRIAATLGYKPRASARALATGRSMTIALQHSMSGAEFVLNPFFGAMLPSMSEAALRAGYAFIFVPPDPPPEVFVTPLVLERRVDAAILIDPVETDSFVQAVLRLGLPAVSLGRIEGHPELPGVDHDHAAACAQVLEHLGSRGYSRPALLSLDSAMSYAQDMNAAFRRMAPAGSAIVAAPELTEQVAYELALELLGGPDRPDSIFCLNDLLAAGVKRAAANLAIEIPGDLGLVGVGDSALASAGPIPMTSMRAYAELAGTRLIELIAAILDQTGNGERPDASLPMELIPRESTQRS